MPSNLEWNPSRRRAVGSSVQADLDLSALDHVGQPLPVVRILGARVGDG